MSGEITFDGQVAIVTGSGRGLGRSYAHDLAARGAKVVVNDIDPEVANLVAGEIEQAGRTAIACTESAATLDGTEAIVKAALDAFGDLHVLVNNASVFGMNYFDQMEPKQITDMVDIHVGYIWLAQHAWRVFQKNGYGRIVSMSSSGIYGHKGSANYAFVKAGVVGLTRQLMQEGEELGIKVNAVCPSGATQGYRPGNHSPGLEQVFAERERKMHGRVEPELTAPIVTYLASRGCVFNGETFHVKGGGYSRVFLGQTEGWLADSRDEITAEGIAEHAEQIADTDGYWIPTSTHDPTERVSARLDALLGAYQA
jgi:NAD(P)-dependent dehydrogenase (short-subunit alcohol dehydrogenase family)